MDTPKVCSLIKTHTVRQKRAFRFSVRKHFEPKGLQFSLRGAYPKWLTIDEKTGILSGVAPAVARDIQYFITVAASNESGGVSQSFYLRVVAANVVDDYAQRLMEILSLRNRLSRPAHSLKRYHLLEYIFAYFEASDEWEPFVEKCHEYAEKLKIDIGPELHYDDFEKIVKASNPDQDIEQRMREQLPEDHPLLNIELKQREFRNLYRQGSQPLGSIAVAVWNYLGAPDQHNFGGVNNVLDSAANAIFELRVTNLHERQLHQPKPRNP